MVWRINYELQTQKWGKKLFHLEGLNFKTDMFEIYSLPLHFTNKSLLRDWMDFFCKFYQKAFNSQEKIPKKKLFLIILSIRAIKVVTEVKLGTSNVSTLNAKEPSGAAQLICTAKTF